MGFNRRTFLKLAAGSGLGLACGPALYKLTDDIAIWTQNWDWLPRPQRGLLARANTVNPLTGSLLRATLVQSPGGDRLIGLTGQPGQGGALPGDISQKLYHHEGRVRTPMLRDRLRGTVRELSWEQALALLKQRITSALASQGPDSLAAWGSDPLTAEGLILQTLMSALEAPRLAFAPCPVSLWRVACRRMLGRENVGFDLARSKYALSLGAPLLEGFPPAQTIRRLWLAMLEAGGQLTQVEPRASLTASLAHTWLACRPGTETAVALGLCHLLLPENNEGQAWAKTPGFQDFAALLRRDYHPDLVSRISGLSTEQLYGLAKSFSEQNAALALTGPEADDAGCLAGYMAVLALNLLKGNLGKPGGLVLQEELPLNPLGSEKSPTRIFPHILELAQQAAQGRFKPQVVLLAGGNPVYDGPQNGDIEEFLREAPFVCAITPFLDESAQMADLLLPAATFLESWGDCPPAFAGARAAYHIHSPLVRPYPQARGVGDVLLSLAMTLGGAAQKALPYKNMRDALRFRAKALGSWSKVSRNGYEQKTPAYGWPSDQPNLGPVFSGREPAPHYEPPAALLSPLGGNELLLAPLPSLRGGSGKQPLTPYMLKALDDTVLRHNNRLAVELNPQTARRLGLREDEPIRLISGKEEVTVLVHLYAGCPPDMVYMPKGLGHKSPAESWSLDKGENYSRLAAVQADPFSGQPRWSLSKVRVEKIR